MYKGQVIPQTYNNPTIDDDQVSLILVITTTTN